MSRRRGVARIYDHLAPEWAELYRQGWSSFRLSQRYGVNPVTIRDYLRRDGVEIRLAEYHVKRGQARTLPWLERAVLLRQQGLSLAEIAAQVKVSRQRVHIVLREYEEEERLVLEGRLNPDGQPSPPLTLPPLEEPTIVHVQPVATTPEKN